MTDFRAGATPTFEGGVFHPDLNNGRAMAAVVLGHETLKASANTGQVYELPLAGLRLQLGGASGKMVFCRHPEVPNLCIYSEARGFADALAQNNHGQLEAQVSEFRAAKTRSRLQLVGVLLACMVAAWFSWLAFKYLVRSAVEGMPFSVDEKIGEMASKQTMSELGGTVVNIDVVDDAMKKIVERLAPEARIKDVNFQLKVVHSDVVNAFALPGGRMVVFTGLISKSESYQEVAAVIGHEMAHVTLRHGLRRVAQSMGVIVMLQLVLGDVGGATGAMAELFSMAAINSYSREQEAEADAEGVRMMYAAGMNPIAAASFFQKMKADEGDLASSGVLSWISTHPETQERIEAIEEQVETLGRYRERTLDIDWAAVQKSVKSLGSVPKEKPAEETP